MAPPKKFQLVLQWPTSVTTDFDQFIEMETELLEHLGAAGIVDGHNMAAGQMNIFILTDAPHDSLQKVHAILGESDIWPEVRVAYREAAGQHYTIIWPADLRNFSVS